MSTAVQLSEPATDLSERMTVDEFLYRILPKADKSQRRAKPNIPGKICWASAMKNGLSANLQPKVSAYGRSPLARTDCPNRRL